MEAEGLPPSGGHAWWDSGLGLPLPGEDRGALRALQAHKR